MNTKSDLTAVGAMTTLLTVKNTPRHKIALARIAQSLGWEYDGGRALVEVRGRRLLLVWSHPTGTAARDQLHFARGCWRTMRGKPPKRRKH